MADIAVVDYGMGNLRSVQQALRTVAPNASIMVTGDPREVGLATRVVFPGQGAMPDCMREMDARRTNLFWESASVCKCFSNTARKGIFMDLAFCKARWYASPAICMMIKATS